VSDLAGPPLAALIGAWLPAGASVLVWGAGVPGPAGLVAGTLEAAGFRVSRFGRRGGPFDAVLVATPLDRLSPGRRYAVLEGLPHRMAGTGLLFAATADATRAVPIRRLLKACGFADLACGVAGPEPHPETLTLHVAARIPPSLRLYRHPARQNTRLPPAPGPDPLPLIGWGLSYYRPYRLMCRSGRDDTAPMSQRAAWRELLGRPARPPAATTSACLLIHGFSAGGAERQLCYLAVALRLAGWRVRVLTVYPPADAEARHYRELLGRHGIEVRSLPHPREAAEALSRWFEARAGAVGRTLAGSWPPGLVHATLATWHALEADRPALLVSYLDSDNMRAALAGLLAGIPHIVLCGRSLHPGHFPVNYEETSELFQTLYRLVLRNPRVMLLNNSRAGADSYARWLGLPARRIGLLPNAVQPDMVREVAAGDCAVFRDRLGIGADDPVVVGVFRFGPEKRPLLFLEVVARLARQFPGLRAVIAGDGLLRDTIEQAIRRRGLGAVVHLLGLTADVALAMAAGDLLLHVSRFEGLPNVVLEAQLLGRPVVATRAGGTAEAVAPVLEPFLCAVDDTAGLVAACAGLLADRPRARALGAAAGRDIRARFTLSALADTLLAAVAHPDRRQVTTGC
jgi:glycosyltransferase involved in cell wall biosynthesis